MKLRRDNWLVVVLSSVCGMIVYTATLLILNYYLPKEPTQNLIIAFAVGLILSVLIRPLLVRLSARILPPPPQSGQRTVGSAPSKSELPHAVVRAQMRRARREQKLKNRVAREAKQRRAKSGNA